MRLRDRLAALFRPRAAGSIPAPRPEWFVHHPWLREAGVSITGDTAIQVAAVYACCRLIVDCIAPAPVRVMEVQKGGKRSELTDDPISWTLNHGAPITQAPDAPTAQAVEEALLWSALIHGDGYAEIQRDGSQRFFALWPLEPERVTPRRDKGGLFYEIQQPEGGTGRIDPADMFHLRGPSLAGWVGDSIVYRASKAVGIAQAAQVYSAAYFANGTVVSGLLSSDKSITPAQAKEAKERFAAEHGGGPGAAHGLAVMGQGLKYQPLNHNAQEAQLVEARSFQVKEIARFFGVPTTLLADNEAWTNLGELYLGFFRSALKPWASRFDQEASRKLVPWKAPWREIEHDLTALTLGSFKDQVSACREAVEGGLWTRNEARAVFGKNSVPDGDVLVSLGTLKSLEDVLDPPEPPAPKPLPAKPEPEEEDGEAPMPAREMSHRAVAVMFAHELERYARKLKNKKPAESIERFRDALAADCASAADFARATLDLDLSRAVIDAAAMSVEQGEPPDLAAKRLLTKEKAA